MSSWTDQNWTAHADLILSSPKRARSEIGSRIDGLGRRLPQTHHTPAPYPMKLFHPPTSSHVPTPSHPTPLQPLPHLHPHHAPTYMYALPSFTPHPPPSTFHTPPSTFYPTSSTLSSMLHPPPSTLYPPSSTPPLHHPHPPPPTLPTLVATSGPVLVSLPTAGLYWIWSSWIRGRCFALRLRISCRCGKSTTMTREKKS